MIQTGTNKRRNLYYNDKSSSLTKLRTVRSVKINPFEQVIKSVTSSQNTKPKREVQTRYGIQIKNSVHEVLPDRPLDVLINQLSASDRLIHKGMNICYIVRSPTSIISITGPGEKEICGVIN